MRIVADSTPLSLPGLFVDVRKILKLALLESEKLSIFQIDLLALGEVSFGHFERH